MMMIIVILRKYPNTPNVAVRSRNPYDLKLNHGTLENYDYDISNSEVPANKSCLNNINNTQYKLCEMGPTVIGGW